MSNQNGGVEGLLLQIAELGNSTLHSVRHEDGEKVSYRPVHRPPELPDVRRHLSTSKSVSIYPLRGAQTRIGVLDFDVHHARADPEGPRKAVHAVQSELRRLGLRFMLVRSSGGQGSHFWILWKKPQSAAFVRRLLMAVLHRAGLKAGARGVTAGHVEVFPKQDVAPPKGGSSICLPFSRQSAPWSDDLSDVVPLDEWTPPMLEALLNADIDPAALPANPPTKKTSSSRRAPPPIGVAASMLAVIPADEYDEWIMVGMVLHHGYGEEGYGTWLEWSRTSDSFGSDQDCESRWSSFGARRGVGIGTLFHLARKNGWVPEGEADAFAEVNARYMILGAGKRPSVIDESPQDPDGLSVIELLGPESLRSRLRAYPYEPEGRNEPQDLGDDWLKSPQSRRVERLIFDPSKEPGVHGASYNMWRGFPVEPVPGDWSLFRAFVEDVIASGNPETGRWLLNWMAWVVQNPAEPIGTAPVLRGLPGTGKGFFANMFGGLWRPHFVTVTSPEHVLGHFNAYLMGRRLIFIDEGTFGGDRKRIGALKTRLTEPVIMIEQKGVDPIQMPNRACFIVASNEESVVPADLNDRRWMMIEVSAHRRQDKGYFGSIARQMAAGGSAAMLHDLLNWNLSEDPDPRETLPNKALFGQFLPTADPVLRYLFNLLDRGILPGSGVDEVARTSVADLVADMRDREGHYGATDSALGKKVREILDPISEGQTGRFTDHFGRSRRTTVYRFPALPEARRRYQRHVGMQIDWTSPPKDWQPDLPA
ncbi:DUF5906 domain-containing protein [Brevundimonas sp.]|uniref:DUF5906 domain-containing protein n=1 Tax=Brevundimonas sp. TaxID=1871086 RepID=UPI003F71F653